METHWPNDGNEDCDITDTTTDTDTTNLSIISELEVMQSLDGTIEGLGDGKCPCDGCDPDGDQKAGGDGKEARILHTGDTTYCEVVLQKFRHQNQVKILRGRCDSTITLLVGPNRHNICGEKALLAYFSQYFEKLLYGSFRESSKLCVNLPEDDPRVVAAFVQWTSSGVIDAASKEIPQQESHFYERLWIYGDKILAPNFCDLTLEFLIQKYRILYGGEKSVRYSSMREHQNSVCSRMDEYRTLFSPP